MLTKYVVKYLVAAQSPNDGDTVLQHTSEGLRAIEVATSGNGRIARELLCLQFNQVDYLLVYQEVQELRRFYQVQDQNTA